MVKEYKPVGEFKLPKKWMEAKTNTVNNTDESVKTATGVRCEVFISAIHSYLFATYLKKFKSQCKGFYAL
jgi:hypothetical protein